MESKSRQDPIIRSLSGLAPSLVPGTVTALIGPPCSGKSTFCMEAVFENIDRVPVIFFVLDRPVITFMRNILSRTEKAKHRLRIIDGYSWLCGEAEQVESEQVYVIENLKSPADISATVSSAICQIGERALFVLDSFSTILSYIDEIFAIRLLNTLIARLRENDHYSLIVFEEDVHSEQFYNKIRHIMDCIIEFKVENDDVSANQPLRKFRVPTCRFGKYDAGWHSLPQSKVTLV